jgi:hypothetical protein
MTGDPRWQLNISVALALEYEAVGKREGQKLEIPDSAINDIVDSLCDMSQHHAVHFDCDRSFPTRTTNSYLSSPSWRDAISS